MKSDIKSLLKAACQRTRKNKIVHAHDEHFTMEDVDSFLRQRKEDVVFSEKKVQVAKVKESVPQQKRILKAASLSDILGFNPKATVMQESRPVPERWKPYYDKLIYLKRRLQSGDLQNETNEDIAVELISNGENTLEEIDAAINRILDGTYGICEITGQPILEQRLLSIPYTRYSLEGKRQMEEEKKRRLLAKMASEQRISDDSDGDDDTVKPFFESDEDQDLVTELEE